MPADMCPSCHGPAEKAIWCGIPFRCCTKHGDKLVAWGLAAGVLTLVMRFGFPFDGCVMVLKQFHLTHAFLWSTVVW